MGTLPGNLNILIVEDSPSDLFLVRNTLGRSGLEFTNHFSAETIREALVLLDREKVHIVLLDLSLPDSSGLASFLKIRAATQKIPVIILTGLTDSQVALEAIKLGAQDYLVKGNFSPEMLAKCIQYSIERKSAEEKILASEEKYRQMFYRNPFPAWIYDAGSKRILEVNDAAIRKYGYERDEFVNLFVKDILSEEELFKALQSVDYSGNQKEKIWRHKKKGGALMHVEVTIYEIDYLGQRAMQVQVNDITEKCRLENELAEQQRIKQQQITDAVLGAQESERKGIAQELHDNINQILATSRLFISSALDQKVMNVDMLTRGQAFILKAMEEIRKLSRALVTPSFKEFGFRSAVESLVKDVLVAKKMEINTVIDIPGELNLSDGLKLTMYRIIQEQLTNILKYAEASAASITVKRSEETIELIISDNGKGFDTHVQRNGIGILNMNSRAEVFNGKVEIESSPGNGCRLKVRMQTKGVLSQVAA